MKKKILALVFCFIMLFSISSFADINGRGVVDADALNVRLTPDMDGEICGKLLNGEVVDIITKTGDWFEIVYGGESCFVHSDYIMASRKKIENIQVPEEETLDDTTGIEEGERVAGVQSVEGRIKAAEVVELAKSFLGTPYVWGGESLEEGGFDCSGLVHYVYSQFGIKLNRVACDQKKNGVAVDLLALMPGDIVLFWNRTYYSEINHVGIYVGNNSFIHAPQTGDVVKITTLESGYYAKNLVAARRIFE